MTAAKQDIRERVWSLLEERGVVEGSVHGTIPDFAGTERAADRLRSLEEWSRAGVVKAVPDRAQLPVRTYALIDSKLLYMAVPRMSTPEPFYELDPTKLTTSPADAATSSGAARVAPTVAPAHMRPVDLVVCGSVAVNQAGARLGKGAGYSDIEFALLHEAGLVSDASTVVTTVHDLQVIDGAIPEQSHDFPVDVIVTPTRAIRCPRRPRPTGILLGEIDEEVALAIPAIASRIPHLGDQRRRGL